MRHRIPPSMISMVVILLITVRLSEPKRLHAESPAILEIGTFSAATPGGPWPKGWKPLTFKKIERHTAYALVREGDRVVVSGIAIMTDADNTGKSATAYYGDILFQRKSD